jgi:ferric-dicitrate binding protein FerR (iron transport regulator)
MEFIKRLFKAYQQHTARPAERKILDAWYEETGNGPRPGWMTDQHLQQAKTTGWQQLATRFGWQAAPVPLTARRYRPLRLQPWMPYAAVFLVAFAGLATFRWFMPATEGKRAPQGRKVYTTAIGIRKKLTLPDGTTIWLNNGSRLTLSLADYTASAKREVWLEEGEAYFEVAKNPARPFLVHVDSLQTRVLGTAFNIQAYRQLLKIQVAVCQGSVQVTASGNVLDTLERNRLLTWNSKDSWFVDNKLLDAQPQWWSNRFVLERAGFGELALRMQLRFGVQLHSSNRRLLQTSFSAGFPDNASLEQVLAVLCTLYKTSYRKQGNQVVIH